MPKSGKPHSAVRRDLSRTVSATKNLRAISQALVEKVQSNEGVSSTEVANQLAQEAVRDVVGTVSIVSPEELVAVEKNIRRRLYDSLKVLVSIGAIARSPKGKSLSWIGVRHLIPKHFQAPTPPSSSHHPPVDPNRLRTTIKKYRDRVVSKNNDLTQLRAQLHALRSLCQRNENAPVPEMMRLTFPFVVIRTPVATEINLESTPDRRNLVFDFKGMYELVNDSGILDRLFVVGKGPPIRKMLTYERPGPSRSTSRRIRPEDPVETQRHNGVKKLLEDPFGSPKRHRISSSRSQFAKFASGRKPPPSPATPLRRRGKKPWQNEYPLISPLQESLRALAGGSIPGAEELGEEMILSPFRAKIQASQSQQETEFGMGSWFRRGISLRRGGEERMGGGGMRMYGPQGEEIEKYGNDKSENVEWMEGFLSAGSSPPGNNSTPLGDRSAKRLV